MITTISAAIGVADHSGWAIVTTVTGERVLDRRRVVLVDEPLPRQPYHAAIGLPEDDATDVIDTVRRVARPAAERTLAEVAAAIAPAVLTAVAVRGEPAEQAPLATILRSPAAVHKAEGELYREVWRDAAVALGIVVCRVDPGGTEPDWLTAEGKRLGSPWQRDHRVAAVAAHTALGAHTRR